MHYDPNDNESANLRIPGRHWWSSSRTVGEAVDEELQGKKSWYTERGISVVPDARYQRLVDGKEGEFWTRGSTEGILTTTTTRFGVVWSVEGNHVTYTIKGESSTFNAGTEGSRGYSSQEKADLGSANVELPKDGQRETLFRFNQAVKGRVQDLGAVKTAEDHAATFEDVTGVVPFFHAVDNFQHGKPWVLSASLDAAALLGPGFLKAAGGLALRTAEATVQRVVLRIGIEATSLETDEAVRVAAQATAEVRSVTANVPALADPHSVGPLQTSASAGPVESHVVTQGPSPLGGPETSLAPTEPVREAGRRTARRP